MVIPPAVRVAGGVELPAQLIQLIAHLTDKSLENGAFQDEHGCLAASCQKKSLEITLWW